MSDFSISLAIPGFSIFIGLVIPACIYDGVKGCSWMIFGACFFYIYVVMNCYIKSIPVVFNNAVEKLKDTGKSKADYLKKTRLRMIFVFVAMLVFQFIYWH